MVRSCSLVATATLTSLSLRTLQEQMIMDFVPDGFRRRCVQRKHTTRPVTLGHHRAQEGTSKNSPQRSLTTKLPSNDSGLFPLRFADVHSRRVRDRHWNQFFEVPKEIPLHVKGRRTGNDKARAWHEAFVRPLRRQV